MIERVESPVEKAIFAGLWELRRSIGDDLLLEFAKMAGVPRYRLIKIVDKEEQTTMATLLRLGMYLEFVGVKVFGRLPKIAMDMLMIYSVSGKELFFFLPDENQRTGFLYYVRGLRALTSAVEKEIQFVVDHHQQLLERVVEYKITLSPIKAKLDEVASPTVKKQVATPVLTVLVPGDTQVVTVQHDKSTDRARLVATVAHSVEAMSALLKYSLEILGPEGRKEVRKQVGPQTINDVRGLLQRLNISDADYANRI